MRKLISILLIITLLFTLTGCADSKVIDGKTYKPYGLFTKSARQAENIQYEVVAGNVVWSILLIETLIFPIYFVGFSLWEPVGPKGTVHVGDVSE